MPIIASSAYATSSITPTASHRMDFTSLWAVVIAGGYRHVDTDTNRSALGRVDIQHEPIKERIK